MARYKSTIHLQILGPFLTAAAGGGGYGLDKSFHRNSEGKLTIPASHIKGKMRMALRELEPFFPEGKTPDLESLFGKGGDGGENGYEPAPSMLYFSEVAYQDQAGGDEDVAVRTRVTIDEESGTARSRHLVQLEDVFASGSASMWQGSVHYFAEDDAEAQTVAGALQAGLQWLGNVGGEKGSGYGRVQGASVGPPVVDEGVSSGKRLVGGTRLHLRISPQEPFLIGEGKSLRTNFIESKREFSGGVIKGALAAGLNRAYGVTPVHQKLDGTYVDKFPGFEQLVTHFSKIRVTHAFPAKENEARPVRTPVSTVRHGDDAWDIALDSGSYALTADGQAAAFFMDWKDGEHYFGSAMPSMAYETRAEIEEISRRTQDGKLFTYGFCQPRNDNGPIEWIGNVYFDNVPEDDRAATREQFAEATERYLCQMGKLGRETKVAVDADCARNAASARDAGSEAFVLVTLQSNTIMVDPRAVGSLGVTDNMMVPYRDYWADISRVDGAGSAFELEDFYAYQDFRGGYLYHRYLSKAEQNGYGYYRPYYLTGAGSVFKLAIRNAEEAKSLLAVWERAGLPLPDWALNEYGRDGQDLWESCPFVPENGFGEIMVNLDWHWDSSLPANENGASV